MDNDKKNEFTRRDFLLIVGALGLFTFFGGALGSLLRFMFPNVLYEPPAKFKLGRPEAYPVGSVTFEEERKVYLFHTQRGYFVISGICTHLGCTVNWDRTKGNFICPCHGSIFTEDGRVTKGPARSPLAWYEVKLGDDGRFLVDSRKVVRPGETFLKV